MEKLVFFIAGAFTWHFVLKVFADTRKPALPLTSEGAPKQYRKPSGKKKPKAHGDAEAFRAEIEDLKRAERN